MRPMFFVILALAGTAVLQFVGPLLMNYRISKRYLVVNVFSLFPIFFFRLTNVARVYEVSPVESLSPMAIKLRNKIFARTVRIERKSALLFRNIDVTPNDANSFIGDLRRALAELPIRELNEQ